MPSKTALLLSLLALAPALAITPPAHAESGLTWRPCPDDRHFRCATFRVPRDWSRPDGQTIGLSVRALPSTSPNAPTLFINPGGPGSSGTDMVSTFAQDSRLRARYTIVGWDPRGVGDSGPALRPCASPDLTTFRPAAGPFTWRNIYRQALSRAARVNQRCWDRNRRVARFVATSQVVQDLDALRRATGDRRLHYYGVSYGTTIGRLYAQAYPQRVGRMLLDGVTDPDLTARSVIETHAKGATSAWRMLFGGMTAQMQDLYRRVEQQLATTPGTWLGEPVDRWRFWSTALTSAPDPETLAGFTCGVAMDNNIPVPAECAMGMLASANPYAAPIVLVQCQDRSGRVTPRQLARATAGLRAEARSNVIQYASFCAGVKDISPVVHTRHLRTAHPPLLINGLWDIKTPYPGAKAAARLYRGSGLVTVRSKRHGLFGAGGTCVDRAGYAYLLRGVVRDRSCPAP